MPTPRQHALLSASSAHRWLACTAAPHFEENFPDGTSSYAEEGTLAHAICELYARKKFTVLSTRKFNSELKKLQARPLYSDEMLRTAEAYVDYLTEKAMQYATPPHVAMEVKVDLTAYVPDGFGTCDCIMIGGDTLHITDYKHGKGVPVSAENNPQMRLYALGALKLYGPMIRNDLDKQTNNANVNTAAEEFLVWHGVRAYSCVHLPAGCNYLLMVEGAVAQPIMADQYTAEKIPLSNAYGVELFYHYGTTVVMPDLIFKPGVFTKATAYAAGTQYYTEANGVYTAVSITEFASGTTYYTMA